MTALFVSITFVFKPQQPVDGIQKYSIGLPQVCHLLLEISVLARHYGNLTKFPRFLFPPCRQGVVWQVKPSGRISASYIIRQPDCHTPELTAVMFQSYLRSVALFFQLIVHIRLCMDWNVLLRCILECKCVLFSYVLGDFAAGRI